MSTAPEPAPRRDPAAALIFEDPLDRQSSDDRDEGWGERAPAASRDDLSWFLEQKPPHHL